MYNVLHCTYNCASADRQKTHKNDKYLGSVYFVHSMSFIEKKEKKMIIKYDNTQKDWIKARCLYFQLNGKFIWFRNCGMSNKNCIPYLIRWVSSKQ